VQLFAAALSRNVRKTLLQVWCLERNKLEPLRAIPPVDPPGQALSEPSVAVVDHYGFMIRHGVIPAFVRSAVDFPR
jgi:hypothetical protein